MAEWVKPKRLQNEKAERYFNILKIFGVAVNEDAGNEAIIKTFEDNVRVAGSDPERIHFATTRANAMQILAALPTIRTGRPSDAFDHYSLKHARIESDAPESWSLDADTHAPASRIDVTAGPTLDFVSLAT